MPGFPRYSERLAMNEGERAAAAAGRPPEDAEQAYRDAIFAAVELDTPVPDVVREAAWRLPNQVARDKALYAARIVARRDLDEEVPRLEREAGEAQRIANSVPSYGARRVGDMTVAQLIEAVSAVQSGLQPAEHVRAIEATRAPGSVRAQAKRQLLETADPAIQARCAALHQAAGEVEPEIVNARAILELPQRIAELQAHCEALGRGEGSAETKLTVSGVLTTTVSEQYRAARKRLLALQARLIELPDARRRLADAQTKRARIGAQLAELEAARLDPKCMKWSD